MVLKGYYKKNIYTDVASGYSVFLIKEEGKDDLTRVCGQYPLVQKNFPLELTGEFSQSDYGMEFRFETAKEFLPDLATLAFFLQDLEVDGMTNRIARKLIRACDDHDILTASFKHEIDEILFHSTHVGLGIISGVTAKIRALLNELHVSEYMKAFGGSSEHARKVAKAFPDDAMEVLQTNAYHVLTKVKIPFKVLDKIGLYTGIEQMSDVRIGAILQWIIQTQNGSGNCYMRLSEIQKQVRAIDPEIPVSSITAGLADNPYVVKDAGHEDCFYDAALLKDELKAARELNRLILSSGYLPWRPEVIDLVEQKAGFHLGGQQRDAFNLVKSTGVKILSGDPGTGKTTTLNLILQYAEIVMEEVLGEKPKVALCAPSGRAAQRMKETTGREARTVHKLLDYVPFGGKEHYKNADDPIDADIVVCDETSMLGVSTFAKLLGAIKNGSLLILIGDVNQLQSVEAGDVLADVIKSGMVERAHLSEVHRQKEDSLININAKHIIKGENALVSGPDFKFYGCKPEDTENCMRTVINEYLSSVPKNDVQVLVPVRKGTCGIIKGNDVLQQIFNPGTGGVRYGKHTYRLGDRVIMLKNNYSLQYFNGDVGFIRNIADDCMEIEIGEEMIKLPKENYGDMDLAYACTVHKSQGSEYPHVVLIMQEDARGMLDQNLFYTAVTRAKKSITVIFENDCVTKAVRTYNRGNRNTLLNERLRTEYVRMATELKRSGKIAMEPKE